MVSNHARKGDARARRAATGETHRLAVDAVRHDPPGGSMVYVIDHPAPDLAGTAPCTECGGRGVSGHLYEQPTGEGQPPLLVDSACTTCLGCGRTDHARCLPSAHVTDDDEPYDGDDFDDDQEQDDEDQNEGDGYACPSCRGRRYYVVQTAPADGPDPDGPYAELLDRARARGVSEWEVTGAAAFGDLDALLGEGAQRLAQEEQRRLVYLLMPCGCAEDQVRLVPRETAGAGR